MAYHGVYKGSEKVWRREIDYQTRQFINIQTLDVHSMESPKATQEMREKVDIVLWEYVSNVKYNL